MKNIKFNFVLALFFSAFTWSSAKAEVTITLHLTGLVKGIETAVIGLRSGRSTAPAYGDERVFSSWAINGDTVLLQIYDLPLQHDRLTFGLFGYCGSLDVYESNSGWQTTDTVNITNAGNCITSYNIDQPWPNPNRREIYSSPYQNWAGSDVVLKYERTRSVLLQIGAPLSCTGTCPNVGEVCSPERILLNDPQSPTQAGTVSRNTQPARDSDLSAKGMSEDRYTPAAGYNTNNARFIGQVYCVCVDFTKP